jgi:hypothetical protein
LQSPSQSDRPNSRLDSYEKERMPVEHSVLKITDFRKHCLHCPLHRAPVQSIGVKTIDCPASKRRRLLGEVGYHYKISEIIWTACKPLALEKHDPSAYANIPTKNRLSCG